MFGNNKNHKLVEHMNSINKFKNKQKLCAQHEHSDIPQ